MRFSVEFFSKYSSCFEVPVCNAFEPQLLYDQLCYMMDLEKFRNNDNIQKQLKEGLVFIMDYNEDRQTWSDDGSQGSYDRNGLFERIEISNDNAGAFIYIDTIGLLNLICIICFQ